MKHAHYSWLLSVESELTLRLFGSMARCIDALAVASGQAETIGMAKSGDHVGEGGRGVGGKH